MWRGWNSARATTAVKSYMDGKNAVSLRIFQLPGTNALETADAVYAEMKRLTERFPPGVDYRINYDPTRFVRQSFESVLHTLLEAIALVVLVVILFLQTWRASIIPLIAVPVSLIGTLAVMKLLGSSLNNLSLFGLVLAIGIVVDDAIVVVENVERYLRAGPFAARGDAQGDERSLRRAGRDRAGALRGVCAGGVSRRHHRPVLPAVRAHHRDRHGDLRLQFAHAFAGAGRPASARARATTSRSESLPVPPRARLLSRSSTPGFERLAHGYARVVARHGPAHRLGADWLCRADRAHGLHVHCACRPASSRCRTWATSSWWCSCRMAPPLRARTRSCGGWMRSRAMKPGVAHTFAISGYSSVLQANQSNVGAAFVIPEDFAKREDKSLTAQALMTTLRKKFADDQRSACAGAAAAAAARSRERRRL